MKSDVKTPTPSRKGPETAGALTAAVLDARAWMRVGVRFLVGSRYGSLRELAKQTGVSYKTVHSAVSGSNAFSLETFGAIAVAAGVDPVDLLREGRQLLRWSTSPECYAEVMLQRHCAATGTSFEEALEARFDQAPPGPQAASRAKSRS